MTARNQPPAKPAAPLENLKPRLGILVTRVDEWWLTPWDEPARAADPEEVKP